MSVTLKSALGDTTLVPENTAGSKTVTIPDVGVGKVLQVVEHVRQDTLTSSAQIPFDNTIPQVTEGVEVLSATITPLKPTSQLKIEVVCHVAPSGTDNVVAALFKDAAADAINSGYNVTSADWVAPILISEVLIAGSTDPQTFSVNIGAATSSIAFNRRWSGLYYGGTVTSAIILTEIAN